MKEGWTWKQLGDYETIAVPCYFKLVKGFDIVFFMIHNVRTKYIILNYIFNEKYLKKNRISKLLISHEKMQERNVCLIPQVLPPASLNFALFQVLRENPTTKYRNRSSYKRSWLYVLFLALGGPFNANVRTATFKEYCVWWGKSAAWNAFYLGILLQNLCHTEKRKCNVSQQGNDVVLTKMKVHVILLNLL